MVEQSVELLQIEVPCDATAPAAVRSCLGEVEELGPSVGDAMLVASELVTNAVLHSGCVEEPIEVRVSRSDETVRIAVSDTGSSGSEAVPLEPGPASRIGQYGLFVVSKLARRWGAAREHGYTVWAELPLAG